MNKGEIAEIRKAFRNCIARLGVCYVNADREIVVSKTMSAAGIEETVLDTYISFLKSGLTGKPESGLLTLEFPAEEEEDGGRQVFLYRVVKSGLNDRNLFNGYMESIASAYDITGNFLILSAFCTYDIPMKTSDGNRYDDMGTDVYNFMITAVCPVTPVSPGLCYDTDAQDFREKSQDWVVKKPETAFLFPSFTDRTANIHECLYAVKKKSSPHEEFAEQVLGCTLPDSAEKQKDDFVAAVSEALGKEADLDMLRNISMNVADLAAERELNGEPTDIDINDINKILRRSGTEKEIQDDIDVKAANIAEKKYTFKGDGITMVVSASRIDSVRQQMDGRMPYLLIPASDLTMNGMPIKTG